MLPQRGRCQLIRCQRCRRCFRRQEPPPRCRHYAAMPRAELPPRCCRRLLRAAAAIRREMTSAMPPPSAAADEAAIFSRRRAPSATSAAPPHAADDDADARHERRDATLMPSRCRCRHDSRHFMPRRDADDAERRRRRERCAAIYDERRQRYAMPSCADAAIAEAARREFEMPMPPSRDDADAEAAAERRCARMRHAAEPMMPPR